MEYLLVKPDRQGYEFRTFQSKEVESIRTMFKVRLKTVPNFRPENEVSLYALEVKRPGEVYDGFFVRWDDGVCDYIPAWRQVESYMTAILLAPFPRDIGNHTIYGLRRKDVQTLLSNAPWVDK